LISTIVPQKLSLLSTRLFLKSQRPRLQSPGNFKLTAGPFFRIIFNLAVTRPGVFQPQYKDVEMNVVEELEVLIELAQQHGYRVRYDYFGGTGGGFCQVNGAKWLFIDLALSPAEQVDHLRQELAAEPTIEPLRKQAA
jgi:hypothetical protein